MSFSFFPHHPIFKYQAFVNKRRILCLIFSPGSHQFLYSHTSGSRSYLVFLGEWRNTSLKLKMKIGILELSWSAEKIPPAVCCGCAWFSVTRFQTWNFFHLNKTHM